MHSLNLIVILVAHVSLSSIVSWKSGRPSSTAMLCKTHESNQAENLRILADCRMELVVNEGPASSDDKENEHPNGKEKDIDVANLFD